MVYSEESVPLSFWWGPGWSGESHGGLGRGEEGERRGRGARAGALGTGSQGGAGGDTGTGSEGDEEDRVPGEGAVGAETPGLRGEPGAWGWKHSAKQGL